MNRTANWLLMTSWSITTVALAIAGAAVYLQLNRPAPLVASNDPDPATASGATAVEPEPARPAPPPLPPVDFTSEGVTMADVVARVIPSVVNISSHHGRTRGRGDEAGDSLGSGVIVSEDGLVVTNNHVVEGNHGITVHLADGRSIEADVVGTDAPSDMALLRLRGSGLNLTPLSYGDSSALRQGDVVLAIGNPFGVGQTVTMGIVSAVGRADMGITEYEDFIQTDAAINPGNSGGALVSSRGELIGINTAILSRTGGSHGIGFAIPSNMVRPIITSLLEHGKVVRGWLGVTIQDVDDMDPALVTAMHLPASQGVVVTDIEAGSPGDVAGMLRGDFIERFDGERLTSTAQLRNLVATRGANAAVTMIIMRAGERRTLNVNLGERPNAVAPGGPVFGGDPSGPIPTVPGLPGLPPGMGVPAPALPGLGSAPVPAPSLPELHPIDLGGLAVVDLDTRVRSALRIPASVARGAVVIDVTAGTPGEDTGIQAGDVIVEVNRSPVNDAASALSAYRASTGSAVMLVRRGSGSLYVLMR